MIKNAFYNTWKYALFILRRERKFLIIWFVALLLITIGQAQSFIDLYSSQMDRQTVAFSMGNPAIVAMMGPAYGKGDYTMGALMSQQTLLFTATAFAIMNILFVCRNTGRDEEKGCTELLKAFPVGRISQVVATILISVVMNIVFGAIIGGGLYELNIESMNIEGSLLFGAVLGVTGIFFSAVSTLVAQLSPRNVLGISFVTLGVSYFVRAIGDIGSEELALISPLGLVMRAKVYVENDWQPILLLGGISIVILVLSVFLNLNRDLGAGLFEKNTGKRKASPLLKNPFALGIRLLGGSTIAWVFSFAILGLAFGAMMEDIRIQLESNEMMKLLILTGGGNDEEMLKQFVSVFMSIAAVIGTIPAMLAILKLKNEENDGRMDMMMSRGVSRINVMSSYLIISVCISILIQIVFAICFWAGSSFVLDDALSFNYFMSSAVSYLPAILMMVGLSVLLIGVFPKASFVLWAYYAYSVFVIYLGNILKLPEEAAKLTSYGNIPDVNAAGVEYTGLIVIIVIAVAITVIGFVGYRKRDLRGD